MSENLISVKNLNYYYTHEWTGKVSHVLSDVNFEIPAGEAFGFLGHNGSGKTTTIKNILGLVKTKKGIISLMGLSPENPKSKQSVGYVPEYPYFYDHLSVQETLELMARLSGVQRSKLKARVRWALEEVKFSKNPRSVMRTLSKGLVQRVAIAQAIIHKPRLLILDEPFSGLDPVGRREIRDLFEKLKSTDCTLFISSHILNDIEHLCDRASIMIRGEIKEVYDLKNKENLKAKGYELVCKNASDIEGKLWEVADSVTQHGYSSRYVFSNELKAKQALQMVIGSSALLEKYSVMYPSLEDIFMDYFKNGELCPF
jgi:ABC-2 type transport system ATP-binding protein